MSSSKPIQTSAKGARTARPREAKPGTRGQAARAPQIPYATQWIDESDIEAVVKVLRSDWLTQGPAIGQFEKSAADCCGAKHAVAVCNATAALHLACLALDLKPGDTLWTSPNSFVASANCALYCGANVDFVDIDPRTGNLSVEKLRQKLKTAEGAGTLPKIVVPVHFAGQSCEMAAIHELSQRHGFRVVEDAAHAIGGRYQSRPIGDGRFSDLTVFSFHPVKIITTGEGGMLLTNRDDLYEKLLRLRTHGITRDPRFMDGESHGAWYYQQVELGFNYRITDLQCALGISQLKRMDAFVSRRRELAQRYDKLLKNLPVTLPWQHPDTESAWHLYVIRLQPEKIRKSRREIFDALRAAGIGVNVHYIPIHTQPHYRRLGFKPGQFPEAERHYAEAISLPMFAKLTDAEQDRVVKALRTILA
jgi:UDP-4-amino-4,6-dideoxy-N-acetyl-beta-L-altrosamine transaminase